MSLGPYDRGLTAARACRADPRFSYVCHVPRSHDTAGAPRPLIVAVHGSLRDNARTAGWFAELADRHGAVVLAPLFPVGVPDGEDDGAYKRLAGHGLRFDLILLSMIEEAAQTWRIATGRFLLFGFSGGGHFAHRFLLAHPDRLRGVSIAAPGIVTLPGAPHRWWVGTSDMAAIFGHPLDAAAVARVPVHAVVGADDTETWEIAPRAGGVWDRPEYGLTGADRPARLAALVDALRRLGAEVLHEMVPGVGHLGAPLAARACDFFDRLLAGPTPTEDPG